MSKSNWFLESGFKIKSLISVAIENHVKATSHLEIFSKPKKFNDIMKLIY